jgi:hypothetical protein
VLLAIKTQDGQFLSSAALQPADLAAKVNGKPVSISRVEPESEKTAVVILMDASGSMGDAARSELELARGIVAALPPGHPTMLVEFADQNTVLASDRAGTVKSLQMLTGFKQGQGRTALWDAIDRALSTLSSPRPIFIVLSDGGDNKSKVHADVVSRKLQLTDVRLIWVEIRSHDSWTPEEKQGAEDTAAVAASTGGFAIRSEDLFGPSAHIERAKLAADAVGAYFHVRLDLPPDVVRTGKLKVSVASHKHEFKEAQLAYHELLRGCPAQPNSHETP